MSFKEIFGVSDFPQLNKMYDSLCIEENEIHFVLNEHLNSKHAHVQHIKKMETVLPNVDLLRQDSKNLSNMILFTSTLADGVSCNVRQLDLAKNHVTDCIQRVEDILDLKSCTDGVQTALQEEDYETAAAHIHRFLTLDEEILRMTADASEGSTLEISFQMLRSAEIKLKTIVHRHFDAAVVAGDRPSIERFFKLFPLLNLQQDGLEKFGKHLCSTIAEQCKASLKLAAISPKINSHYYADLLTVIFEIFAKHIETSLPLVETYYGPGMLLSLLTTLQRECDRQCRSLLEQYRVNRNYDNIVHQIRQSGAGAIVVEVDPRDLDPLLSELVLMNTRTELYIRFIRRRAEADLALSSAGDVSLNKFNGRRSRQNSSTMEDTALEGRQRLDDLTQNCELSCMLQDLLCHYVLLEEFFMCRMVDKAILLDNVEIISDSLTNSMLDDAFFVVRKSLRRAASSGSVDGLCALLNLAQATLTEQLANAISLRLRSGFIGTSSGWVQGAYQQLLQQSRATGSHYVDSGANQRRVFLQSLNNLQVADEHLATLRSGLEQELKSLFVHSSEISREKMAACLSELCLCSSNCFRQLLDKGHIQICTSLIRPQVKHMLTSFQAASYLLSEQELAANEAHDPWIETLVIQLEALICGLRAALTPANTDRLVQSIAVELISRLEKLLMRKAFNRLGALQLDREFRCLINYMTSATTWSIREKFARLSQASVLLNLEQLEEVIDYWTSPGITWRLTPAEVRQILALRQEFSASDIRRIKL